MSKPITRFYLFIVYLFVLILVHLPSKGQTEKPIEALNNYNANYPLEKAYLHTDRKHYAPGEQLWFQAYVTAGYFNEPSPLSKNLYVALFSSDKKLIDKKLVRLEAGIGHGLIELSNDLAAGSYVIRAYTNWMKNFDDAFFFEKELIIIGDNSTSESNSSSVNSSIDLQFFPEGGHLVDNVPGRLAFKAVDNMGRGIATSGIIFNNLGDEITRFNTEHDGMGAVVFSPSKGISYTARLDSTDADYSLPQVQAMGFGISVNNNLPEVLRITVRSNNATKKKDKVGMIIHTRGAISYAFELDLSNNIALTSLPKSDIPAGIVHITLFDSSEGAVLERLVYIDQPGKKLQVSTDKLSYSKREKVTMTVEVTDSEGKPVSGAFSLSAIDLGQAIDRAPETTIISDLLLTSDLKGHIANPMYYFNSQNINAKKHLDLVMMTHGWSRFRWSELSDLNQTRPTHKVEQSLVIKGKMLKTVSSKPVARGKVTLINQQSFLPLILETESGNDGVFKFENVVVYENEELLFQGQNSRGKNLVDFEIDSSLIIDQPHDYHLIQELQKSNSDEVSKFEEKAKYRNLIDESYDFDTTATLLETVIVEGNRLDSKVEVERKGIYGRGDKTLRFDDRPIFVTNPLELIQGKIGSVVVSGSGQQASVSFVGSVTGSGSQLAPLILIDDIATDISILLSYPANIIDRVEVYSGPTASVFGIRGAGGVLAFYTKTGADLNVKQIAKGVYVGKLKNSYHKARDFYAPKYGVEKPEHIKPDSRIVLHWQPLILLDETGKAYIEFWHSDQDTDVLLDLQGITSDGEPLAITLIYEGGKN